MATETISPLDAMFKLPAETRAKVLGVFDDRHDLRELYRQAVEAQVAGKDARAMRLADEVCKHLYPILLKSCGPEVAALFDPQRK